MVPSVEERVLDRDEIEDRHHVESREVPKKSRADPRREELSETERATIARSVSVRSKRRIVRSPFASTWIVG